MLVADFDYELPREQIAQHPPAERGASRMLSLARSTGAWRDGWFRELPEQLNPGDVLVLNDSRVIPARLFAIRGGGGTPEAAAGTVEVLLTEQISAWEWRALVRPGRKATVGQELTFAVPDGGQSLHAAVTAEGPFGERVLRFSEISDFFARLEQIGHVPLPPYIRRRDQSLDRERYQTVFARQRGSVAAPTAGLHFTPEVLERIRSRGVRVCYLTLHVGLGTFQPVRVAETEEIRLHSERYSLPAETAAEVASALEENRRVIAVGTTTVRTLEHCAHTGNLKAHSGITSIFLSASSQFRVVGGMVTNFHLQRSTLLMLVSAFAGREHTLAAYRHAVQAGYRFYSYGDCMFIS